MGKWKGPYFCTLGNCVNSIQEYPSKKHLERHRMREHPDSELVTWYECKVPDCPFEATKHKESLTKHTRKMHPTLVPAKPPAVVLNIAHLNGDPAFQRSPAVQPLTSSPVPTFVVLNDNQLQRIPSHNQLHVEDQHKKDVELS